MLFTIICHAIHYNSVIYRFLRIHLAISDKLSRLIKLDTDLQRTSLKFMQLYTDGGRYWTNTRRKIEKSGKLRFLKRNIRAERFS